MSVEEKEQLRVFMLAVWLKNEFISCLTLSLSTRRTLCSGGGATRIIGQTYYHVLELFTA